MTVKVGKQEKHFARTDILRLLRQKSPPYYLDYYPAKGREGKRKSLLLKQKDDKITAQKAEVNREISKLRQETGKNWLVLSRLYENFAIGITTKAEYWEMYE